MKSGVYMNGVFSLSIKNFLDFIISYSYYYQTLQFIYN